VSSAAPRAGATPSARPPRVGGGGGGGGGASWGQLVGLVLGRRFYL